MYCNEIRGGKHRGFWLIDEHNVPQPSYDAHQRFLVQAKQWVSEFHAQQGRPPTADEFRQQAVIWLRD
jgi:hypothetical protein